MQFYHQIEMKAVEWVMWLNKHDDLQLKIEYSSEKCNFAQTQEEQNEHKKWIESHRITMATILRVFPQFNHNLSSQAKFHFNQFNKDFFLLVLIFFFHRNKTNIFFGAMPLRWMPSLVALEFKVHIDQTHISIDKSNVMWLV